MVFTGVLGTVVRVWPRARPRAQGRGPEDERKPPSRSIEIAPDSARSRAWALLNLTTRESRLSWARSAALPPYLSCRSGTDPLTAGEGPARLAERVPLAPQEEKVCGRSSRVPQRRVT